MRSGAALSPRRATYLFLLRQNKVSQKKATLVSASLRCATGTFRCSAHSQGFCRLESDSGSRSGFGQTIATNSIAAYARITAARSLGGRRGTLCITLAGLWYARVMQKVHSPYKTCASSYINNSKTPTGSRVTNVFPRRFQSASCCTATKRRFVPAALIK